MVLRRPKSSPRSEIDRWRDREREIRTILRGRSVRCSAAAGAEAGRKAEGSPAGGTPEADTPAHTPAAGTPAADTPAAGRRPSHTPPVDTLIITQKQLNQKPSKPQKFENEFERDIATLGRRDADWWLLLVVVAHLSPSLFSPAAEIGVEKASMPKTKRELGERRAL